MSRKDTGSIGKKSMRVCAIAGPLIALSSLLPKVGFIATNASIVATIVESAVIVATTVDTVGAIVVLLTGGARTATMKCPPVITVAFVRAFPALLCASGGHEGSNSPEGSNSSGKG